MILRKRYLDEVRSVLGKPLVKVFLGMRRVGKSTLLLQIQEDLHRQGVDDSHIISMNFEWLAFEALKDYRQLNAHLVSRMTDKEKYYVFLDEVQEVDGFEKVVSSLNAKGMAEIFITGSNSRLLSGELATYLTGRYYTIEVLPLSFSEIVSYRLSPTQDEMTQSANPPSPISLENRRGEVDALFMDYLRMGGLPGRFMFDQERTGKNYILDLYQSILLRDIVGRHNIRDVDMLQRFMLFLMNNTAQIFSANTITNFLKSEGRKLSKETIYHYIEAAKNAYLAFGIPRYNIRGKVLMKTNEKYFLNDLGIRSLYFDNEKDIGQALENIVYLELKRRGYDVFVGTAGDKEVDFIVKDGAATTYIQVAYLLAEPSTIEREFNALMEIDDNFPKLILSLDRVNRSMNGIVHKNLIDYMMEEW